MAGSAMTFAVDNGVDDFGNQGRIRKLTVNWTSDDTNGSVSGTTPKIVGELIKGITDPQATAPTDDYDIAITDGEGVDVLGSSVSGLGNRDTANTEHVYFGLTDGTARIAAFPVVCDALTIAVTNAGNSKVGQLILYFRV